MGQRFNRIPQPTLTTDTIKKRKHTAFISLSPLADANSVG